MIKIVSMIILIIFLAGCANTNISGSFVNEGEKTDMIKEELCYDSDDGDNIDIAGTVSIKLENGNILDYTDYCIDKSSLMEYFCEDYTYKSKTYKCRNACVNGACR